jgi:hypothetical protein
MVNSVTKLLRVQANAKKGASSASIDRLRVWNDDQRLAKITAHCPIRTSDLCMTVKYKCNALPLGQTGVIP